MSLPSSARWEVTVPDATKAKFLAESLHISPITTQLLINRGIADLIAAKRFLYPSISDLPDPLLMLDMQKACERVLEAIVKNEKILIYGDFDADGVTATALLVREMTKMGCSVEYYLPDRFNEGYDLSVAAVERAAEDGYQLMITVDCGSKAVEAAQRAIELNLTLIITDHHTIGERELPAYAFINPHRPGSPQPTSEIAGVGVAYQMARALRQLKGLPADDESSLDLVALGTVADVVPILEDNRTLIKFGLEKLRKGENIGIVALCEFARQEIAEIDTTAISYSLAPRLNAAGRLGDAKRAVELLLTQDAKVARELATGLEEENRKRRKLGDDVLLEAKNQLLNTDDLVLVLSGESWHQGVIGIAASRLSEELHRPVFLICTGEEPARGSARGPKGVDVYEIAKSCQELLVRFGGHKQACGFTIENQNIGSFAESVNSYAEKLYNMEDFVPRLSVDSVVPISLLDASLLEELSLLAPYGLGNPEPIFLDRNVRCGSPQLVGKDHLRMTLSEGVVTAGIAFHMADRTNEADGKLDLAYTPRVNRYWGNASIEIQILDFHPSRVSLIKMEIEDARNREFEVEGNEMVLERVNGELTITGDNNRSQTLIIKETPLEGYELASLLSEMQKLRRVVLVYKEENILDAENVIRKTLPDRSLLRDIYLYLRDFASKNDVATLSKELFLSENTIELALGIFTELGLVKDGKAVNGTKAELGESAIFRFVHTRRQRAMEMAKIWRKARQEDIKKIILLYLPLSAS